MTTLLLEGFSCKFVGDSFKTDAINSQQLVAMEKDTPSHTLLQNTVDVDGLVTMTTAGSTHYRESKSSRSFTEFNVFDPAVKWGT